VHVAGNDGSTVEVTGTDVVLAAGSVPRTIPGFDIDGALVLTSDEVLALDRLPESVAVIGGGAIGCEFASMFADLGTSVTVFEALPTILNECDEDVARTVARSFKKRGIDVKAGVTLNGHTPDPSGSGTVVSYGEGEQLSVEAVVVSVGRRPRSEGLVTEDAGVTIDERGFVVVKKDPFGGNSRARIIGDTEGMVKVIAEKRSDGTTGRILGVHMVGPWVTEQLGAGYLAVNWEATADEVAQFVQPHPSLSETFGETVLALTGRGLHVA
jgi:dihydrolipoamide dehydrogenase